MSTYVDEKLAPVARSYGERARATRKQLLQRRNTLTIYESPDGMEFWVRSMGPRVEVWRLVSGRPFADNAEFEQVPGGGNDGAVPKD